MAYVRLIELVRKFDSGVIELPLMQRDYVWPAAKVVNLANESSGLHVRPPGEEFCEWSGNSC